MKGNTIIVEYASKGKTSDSSVSGGCPVCHDLGQVDVFTCVENAPGTMEFTQARKICPRCGGASVPPPLTGGAAADHSPPTMPDHA